MSPQLSQAQDHAAEGRCYIGSNQTARCSTSTHLWHWSLACRRGLLRQHVEVQWSEGRAQGRPPGKGQRSGAEKRAGSEKAAGEELAAPGAFHLASQRALNQVPFVGGGRMSVRALLTLSFSSRLHYSCSEGHAVLHTASLAFNRSVCYWVTGAGPTHTRCPSQHARGRTQTAGCCEFAIPAS